MRVALVSPYSMSSRGGVQNHVLGLAQWLGEHGHRPAILAPGRIDPQVLADHRLDPTCFTSSGRAIPVRYNGSVARINFGPLTHSRVSRWLDQVAPDVVHLHEPITPSVSLLGLWSSTAPVVATFHTATPGSQAMKWAGQVLTGSVDRIRGAIAVSEAAADVVRRYIGLDPAVIGNGIWTSRHLLPEPTTRWRGGPRPRITFLGRYDEPRKGYDTFREAVHLVRQQRPEIEVVVAGDGAPRRDPGILHTGALSDADRNVLLASTDLYVAPHLGRESFGIVLLEALASGAGVVASDLPAFREVLADDQGVVGRLFPVGDPWGLASAVLDGLDRGPQDPARGRRHADRFDWSRVAPRVLDVYLRAMSAAGSAPGRAIA